MDYDFERINITQLTANCNHSNNNNGINNNKLYTSESPTSSSISSTNSSSKYSSHMMTPSKANHYADQQSTVAPTQMSSSTSLIFSTASQFHISQNDVVYYSRETMHLLAKFLAANSTNTIFRSLYGYAPDNLAWLWAFLDWDTPIDLNKVPCQETYYPFKALDNRIGQDKLEFINKLFAEAPLVQYIYRGSIMIGDVFKFIEYIQSIRLEPVAKALFLLYFPRFNKYVENDLKCLMQPKLLKKNLNLIQKMDDMICALIKSRYTNLDEYKEKIIRGNGLPSYIKSLLKENNFWPVAPLNDDLYQYIMTPMSALNDQQQQEIFTQLTFDNLIFNTNNLIENLNLNNDDQTNVFDSHFEPNSNNLSNANFVSNIDTTQRKTIDYMKLLNESNKVNDDLDHISFDHGNNHNNNNNDLDLDEADLYVSSNSNFNTNNNCNNITNATNGANKFTRHYNKLIADLPINDAYTQGLSNTTTPIKTSYLNSPSSNLNPSIHAFTPKTPSNMNEYSFASSDTSTNTTNNTSKQNLSVWSNESMNKGYKKLNQTNTPLTPPPSAKFKTTPLNIVANNNVNNQSTECLSPSLIKSPPNFLKNKLTDQCGDQLNHYLKHQFYGSPITRVNHFKGTPLTGLKHQHQQRIFNSNGELNSSRCSSPARSNDLIYEERFKNNNIHKNTSHVWSGHLAPKVYLDKSIYSRKVFLGGLPWDANKDNLLQILSKFGNVRLEIPGKDSKHPRVSCQSKTPERATPGYVYIIFEHESSVQRLLSECRKEIKNGGEHYFFTIIVPHQQMNQMNKNHHQQQRGKAKEVEVIPWNQEDTSYVPTNKPQPLPAKIDTKSTIFVGALHGMLNAQGLSKVMSEVFGEVIHASLDTDKYKYPIGSGRVTFRNRESYVKAIKAKFVTIIANSNETDPSPKFEKTIQIDPYLEEAVCCKCPNKSTCFCRNEACLDYYCDQCWKLNHDTNTNTGEHLALSRMQSTKPTF